MVSLNRSTPDDGNPHETPAEVAALGRRIYDERLRSNLETTQRGKFVVINVRTGEYEVGSDEFDVSKRARERFGDAPRYSSRIGESVSERIGANSGADSDDARPG